LPSTAPIPTLWSDEEKILLSGTSLESAVSAKLAALNAEFEALQEVSSKISRWNEMFWTGDVGFSDWVLLDALYRSRCLELPRSGISMVPCIDMVNHSTLPTAYYDENSNHEVNLLVRPDVELAMGDEVTITYGEAKSGAEMLFSYGFFDPDSVTNNAAFPIAAFADDPLGKAKAAAFGEPPKILVARKESGITWGCPFAYFMCLNEEDGLGFKVLQDNDGSRSLRVFWENDDVTERTKNFEELLQGHPFQSVLKLRVVTVIAECLQAQLDRMSRMDLASASLASTHSMRQDCLQSAALLRSIESDLLNDVLEVLEEEVSRTNCPKHVPPSPCTPSKVGFLRFDLCCLRCTWVMQANH
jgi:hypothetical protein